MTDPPILPPPPPSAGGGWNAVGPYATSAMPMTQLRPLAGLATALTVLLAIAALICVFGAWALFDRASLFDDVADGLGITFDEATSADDRVATAFVMHIVAFLATGVVFIIWQFRHAKNAQLLGARDGLGPGWAIGGWFVPFANYVLPAMQMHQSSRASDLDGRRRGTSGRGSGTVLLWALVFGLASLVFSFGGGLDGSGETDEIASIQDLEDAASQDRALALGFGLYALSALAAIAMVRDLTTRQTTTHAAMAAATAQAVAAAASPSTTPDSDAAAWAATSPDWAGQGPQRVYEPPPADPVPPPAAPPTPPAESTIPPPPGAPPAPPAESTIPPPPGAPPAPPPPPPPPQPPQ